MRLFSLIALIGLLFAAPAQAGTLTYCTTLDSGTNVTATATSAIKKFAPVNISSMSAVAFASNSAGTNPTLALVIQSCSSQFDTTTCRPWATFSQFTTAFATTAGAYESQDMNRDLVNWFPYFRVVSTIGGTATPTFTYTVQLCYS